MKLERALRLGRGLLSRCGFPQPKENYYDMGHGGRFVFFAYSLFALPHIHFALHRLVIKDSKELPRHIFRVKKEVSHYLFRQVAASVMYT